MKNFWKFKNLGMKKGMTFLELIVVLSIFAIISSISIFQYRDFQDTVDLKNYANDIALKIGQAQIDSINGKLISGIPDPAGWTPSYGVKFDFSNNNNTKFAYYVNTNNVDEFCNTSACTPPFGAPYHNTFPTEKVIDVFTLNKGFYISSMWAIGQGVNCSAYPGSAITNIEFRFRRPNVTPIFYVSPPFSCASFQYADIIITSPKGKNTKIRVHATGQIQLTN